MTKIAIIGGSGLENPDLLKNASRVEVETPYGAPSSDFITGEIAGIEVVILSRHGRKHNITPTQVNNKANIWAINELGCTHIIATTACGSLREEIDRGHLVVLDQFIDFTRMRKLTFFDDFNEGMKHTPMADPFDATLREKLVAAAKKEELTFHEKGTVISIEGPRFSTRAESHMFRMWGADVINMSVAPECALANEMEIPYAAVAMSTDYDCWKTDEEPVTMEAVMEVFKANVSNVLRLLVNTIENF
ncbi:S-methyl-5'-thioadenosine phosphorylase [Prolixibacteraceae bacterium JC049]|nr:S-methyl-5'-thioadenosine phosphorylase [Prolixibacteraceae bacterium JC049]